MKDKKYIEVESDRGGKVIIPVHQVQFIMNDGLLVYKSENSGKNIGVKLTKEAVETITENLQWNISKLDKGAITWN